MMKNGRPAGDALGMPGKQVDERLKKNYEFRRELYFVLRKSDWAVVRREVKNESQGEERNSSWKFVLRSVNAL